MDTPKKALPGAFSCEESDDGGGVISGICALVPDGEYEVRYVDYETARFFGNPKVILHCAIVVPEAYAGTPVDRFYNVSKLIGPPKVFGNFDAPMRGDLVREFRRVVKEPDRISFVPLRNKRLIVEIETVTTDYEHNMLSREDQYSRIKRLIQVLPDEYW